MHRFYASTKALGKFRNLFHGSYRYPGIHERFLRPARRKDFPSALCQSSREVDDASFIGDGEESARHDGEIGNREIGSRESGVGSSETSYRFIAYKAIIADFAVFCYNFIEHSLHDRQEIRHGR